MAELFRRNKTWWVDFTVSGRRVRKSLKTKQLKVAEEACKALEGDLVRQEHRIPLQDVDVKDALDEFVADRKTKSGESWVKAQDARIRTFLEQSGIKRLDDITPLRLEKYLRDRQAAHSAIRARDDFRIIRTFLRWCMRMGYLMQNPITKVEPPPPPPRKSIEFLSREEADRLLAACDAPVPQNGRGHKGKGNTRPRRTPLGTMARVALYAGLRAGEIVTLQWEDIDFKKGLLHVRVRDEFTPKDKESRVVPLHPTLQRALEMYRDTQPERDGYLFQTANGTSYGVAFIHHELVKVAKTAKLKANWYTLRHTFGTWLAQEGVSLHIIAKFLGHASVTTTERHYASLMPQDLGHVIAKL